MTSYIAPQTTKLALRSIELATCIDKNLTALSNKAIVNVMPYLTNTVAYAKIADEKLSEANQFILATESLTAWGLAELGKWQNRNADFTQNLISSLIEELEMNDEHFRYMGRLIAQTWVMLVVITDNALNTAFCTEYECGDIKAHYEAIKSRAELKELEPVGTVETITEEAPTMPNYQEMTTRSLRSILKSNQVKGYSRMSKVMMVEACQDLYNQGAIS